VPLARNPDVILRSDLDLRVRNDTNMVPLIEGAVKLRDSFLLRDIATLVPGRVATPERRPPYFSLPQDPMDQWKLDIRVRGEEFMRVRSPFFQGVASANFHVIGTLEEPSALGEAAITSGRLIFPFASLQVRQALVSLTSENPYLPRIFAVAAGRAFGFDIRMEAEGWADEPVIEFTSVPALTSEQIILMLTTGQIPREDFGFSQQDRASKLAFFLGKSLWQKLNPGKSGEERLTIRSGQDITEQGRQTYEVEYKLSDRWALVGEYDRFGALNANVKWRLLSR
jgi:translocation and assembly module TamB